MPNRLQRQRECYAGALMTFIGVLAGYVATTYDIGSLRSMGPGFFPLVLSVLIAALGIAIAVAGARGADTATAMHRGAAAAHGRRGGFDLRGWVAIFVAVIAFIVLAWFAGMAPATFACVFIAALGDRQNTFRSAALFALGLTVFAVVVLAWALHVQMPIFKGL